MKLRADGQFNTTIYNEDDRFRDIYGGRHIVLMNAKDMSGLGCAQGDLITLRRRPVTASSAFVSYDIPRKCRAGYYPKCNGLVPLWHFAEASKVPAAKSVPVRISRDAAPEEVDA